MNRTYVWTSYCIKQIDASNYKTAYVSGTFPSHHPFPF
jgi:hypothetical protein